MYYNRRSICRTHRGSLRYALSYQFQLRQFSKSIYIDPDEELFLMENLFFCLFLQRCSSWLLASTKNIAKSIISRPCVSISMPLSDRVTHMSRSSSCGKWSQVDVRWIVFHDCVLDLMHLKARRCAEDYFCVHGPLGLKWQGTGCGMQFLD